MNRKLLFGYCSATLLVFSSMAHVFGGWSAVSAALEQESVDAQLIAAIGVGWIFGSAAMLAFGIIVLISTQRSLRGDSNPLAPIWTIATTYLLFGVGAFVARDFNPHFLLFVAIGAMVAGYAWSASAGTVEPKDPDRMED